MHLAVLNYMYRMSEQITIEHNFIKYSFSYMFRPYDMNYKWITCTVTHLTHHHGTIRKILRRENGAVAVATLHKQPFPRTLCCVIFIYTDLILCKILGSYCNTEDARFLRWNRIYYCTFTDVSEECGSMFRVEEGQMHPLL